jgi:hypothetical protein
VQDISLLPITQTSVKLNTKGEDLSVGEEKVFELVTNRPENIKPVTDWQSLSDIDYRITENSGQLFLHLLAYATGNKTISIPIQTYKPYMSGNKLLNELILVRSFTVKAGGLVFLQTDKTDFVLDDKTKNEGVEIQIDNNKLLQLNTEYLLEAKDATGSPLIAELYTKLRLANNKILCILRVYNYHRKADGYLYLKDGNSSKFITNFTIIPKVTIDKIKIMRNGKDWVDDAIIYPGETINLRIEGQSLDKAHFHFGELLDLASDSIVRNETFAEYKVKVPMGISKKTIDIMNGNQSTGKTLTIKEYLKAHTLDYITVGFGDRHRLVSKMNGPDLYDKTIRDVLITFQPDKIDGETDLYGKQYINIQAKILGKKDEIIDEITIDDFAVCPDSKSPRYQFYDKSDCKNAEISLNSKLSNTTYSLSEWSKIKITFKNTAEKYSQNAQSKTVEIVLQKQYNFDVDVSFPTGLLIKKMNTAGYGDLGGVSMAVLGQFSFYQKDKINRFRPYKIGAGFLALNAFDFSHTSTNGDIGVVVLGTLSPVNTDRKLTFSIYLGGGYLLNQKTMFWLIGPGFSVKI